MHKDQDYNANARRIINALWRERGFSSPRALAIASGVPQPTLWRFLNGATQDIGLQHLAALADTLDLSMGQILGEVALLGDPRGWGVMRAMDSMSEKSKLALIATANALAEKQADTEPD